MFMNQSQTNNEISVSEYIDILNEGLRTFDARVIGEVTEVQLYPGRNYLFFKIKDKADPALLTCFMWKREYTLSGVDLQVGLEVIISGAPSIYKPLGRLSFQTQTVELVGEGQLKKAYDELKAKLTKEGLFSEVRKRPLPTLPQKIGLITSKDGAAIGDFQMNLGRFGFQVSFIDSRVEGQLAVAELLSAIRTFRNKDIEVLVLVRGGGSLESLLPFNNETLVREVVNFPVPVLVGVGHEKDISLIGLVADKMVSTPTATAQALNYSWEQATAQMELNKHKLLSIFSQALNFQQKTVQESFQTIRNQLQSIFDNFDRTKNLFLQVVVTLRSQIEELRRTFTDYPNVLKRTMHALIHKTYTHISTVEKIIEINNPGRQLKLGYSITRTQGSIVRSVSQVQVGQNIEVSVCDGSFSSDVKKITKDI